LEDLLVGGSNTGFSRGPFRSAIVDIRPISGIEIVNHFSGAETCRRRQFSGRWEY